MSHTTFQSVHMIGAIVWASIFIVGSITWYLVKEDANGEDVLIGSFLAVCGTLWFIMLGLIGIALVCWGFYKLKRNLHPKLKIPSTDIRKAHPLPEEVEQHGT